MRTDGRGGLRWSHGGMRVCALEDRRKGWRSCGRERGREGGDLTFNGRIKSVANSVATLVLSKISDRLKCGR